MAKKLTIDPQDLIEALTSGIDSYDYGWFLDKSSGDVILAGDGSDVSLSDAEDHPDYLRIEPSPSHDAYQVMADFVDELSDERIANALSRALDGKKPFRRFKDTLLDFPETRAAWFAFEEAADLRRAEEWCKENGFTVEWRSR